MALRLRQLGVLRVYPLAGGFQAWRALGLPVESYKRDTVIVSWW